MMPRRKAPAGVPLRQAPDKTDNLQRLARIADKSGIPILRAYPLKWWHRVLAVFLITGLLATAGWSAWAYRHGRDLRPTIKVAGGPDMHVKATLERRESGEWQKVVTRTGLPFQIEVAPGSDYRLVPYGDDEKQLLVSEEFRNLRQNLAVQWAAEEAAAAAEAEGLGYLVATNASREVLNNHKVTVRNALFSQTVDADQTLHLAPGQWQVRVEADAAPPDTEGPSSVSGSAWLTVDVEAGKKTYQEVATEAYFRDRLKGGGYGPQMVSIPAGSFTMGSPESEPGHDSDEGPQHGVTLKAFAIGRYEVTFDAYDAFCEATDREKPDDEGWGRGRRPVINVSWEDARAYAAWLTEQTGTEYRLPTEAEWEYAARANTQTTFYWSDDTPEGGDDTQDACRYGNLHDETSKLLNKFEWPHAACPDDYGQTAPAGMFAPNTFGLYDVAGNVWEWVNDRYANDYYQYSPGDNPSGPDTGVNRVVRGGSWSLSPS
jgi:formylglycine-generating enzyme required for sulfatase activity